MSEGAYKNGHLDGKYAQWVPDGSKRVESEFLAGIQVGASKVIYEKIQLPSQPKHGQVAPLSEGDERVQMSETESCPKGHGKLKRWEGELRCWSCGWPDMKKKNRRIMVSPEDSFVKKRDTRRTKELFFIWLAGSSFYIWRGSIVPLIVYTVIFGWLIRRSLKHK